MFHNTIHLTFHHLSHLLFKKEKASAQHTKLSKRASKVRLRVSPSHSPKINREVKNLCENHGFHPQQIQKRKFLSRGSAKLLLR